MDHRTDGILTQIFRWPEYRWWMSLTVIGYGDDVNHPPMIAPGIHPDPDLEFQGRVYLTARFSNRGIDVLFVGCRTSEDWRASFFQHLKDELRILCPN